MGVPGLIAGQPRITRRSGSATYPLCLEAALFRLSNLILCFLLPGLIPPASVQDKQKKKSVTKPQTHLDSDLVVMLQVISLLS